MTLLTMRHLTLPMLAALTLLGRAARAEPAFSIRCDAVQATAGQAATARVRIEPGKGYHVNTEYPTAVTFNPPAGLSLDKSRLGGKDARRLEAAGAEFDVQVTAARAGKATLPGELKFAVCTADTCDPRREKLTCPIDVK